MKSTQKSVWPKLLRDIGPVVIRNVFSLVSVIIGALAIALIVLGQTRDGVFIASVVVINIVIGIVQELRARYTLEKLQLLNATSYEKLVSSKWQKVLADDIVPNDTLQLSLGDQVPVDCEVIKTNGLEVNEALLTGESDNIAKSNGDKLLGGSVVVAGSTTVKVLNSVGDSFIGKMGGSLKQYRVDLSPIQKALLRFIRVMVVVLLVVAFFLLVRNIFVGTTLTTTITQTAALAATIIAEGLLLASTVLFAYGAIRMSARKVLLQQITAAENLGRIQYLCIDKTGTLTQNQPVLEELIPASGNQPEFKKLLARYIGASDDNTATSAALKKELGVKPVKAAQAIPFSSSRKYSLLKFPNSNEWYAFGAPEKVLTTTSGHEAHIDDLAASARRVLVLAKVTLDKKEKITSSKLLGIVALKNPLKQGVTGIVQTLQARGVNIRVISGDNPATVRAIAQEAGIEVIGRVVVGDDLKNLGKSQYQALIAKHSIFARITPEQKQKLVRASQSLGFTAMVGDGANDALAIKRADIGIAMFDGANVTRQIADVVLLNNSFSAIPEGIKVSDLIITTLEMIAIVFFTRVWSGLFIFAVTLVANLQYPFTPRNITIINYFIIGLPVVLWGLWPRTRDRKLYEPSFLLRTLPFSVLNGIIIAITALIGVFVAGQLGIGQQAATITFWIFLLGCLYTLALIPRVVGANPVLWQDRLLSWIPVPIIGLVLLASWVAPVARFFDLQAVTGLDVIIVAIMVLIQRALQFGLSRLQVHEVFIHSAKKH